MPLVSSSMGTAEAIERVSRERYAVYLGAAAGIVGSRERAADAVQEGFARALQHAGRFRSGSLEAWIWRIVLNCARDTLRRPAGLPLPAALRGGPSEHRDRRGPRGSPRTRWRRR